MADEIKYNLDDEKLAATLRSRSVDLATRRLLMTQFAGSDQAKDLTLAPNCGGFGRLHHFRERVDERWIPNPLPAVPARAYLGLPATDTLIAQVFQLGACNWRCWYCYVDFKLLSANLNHASFTTAEELLQMMLGEPVRSQVLDLSGGQPDLVPEYALWFLEAREQRGLAAQLFVWLDDNLSNDYLWRYLTDQQVAYMVAQPGVARVGCLKGIDEDSFSFNTKAPGTRFYDQIEVLSRLVASGFDQYGYITLTTRSLTGIADSVARLLDRIQSTVHSNFPLRIVPLRVSAYQANAARYDETSDKNQYHVLDVWLKEMDARFSAAERSTPINEVAISG